MKLRSKKQLLSLSLATALLLTGCSTQLNSAPETKTEAKQVISNNSSTDIKGKIVFPDSFNTKIHIQRITRIKDLATVSLLYPSDYSDPALRDTAIATSLTDDAGDFTMALDTFHPRTDVVYYLEANKRIANQGNAGNFQMALRTHVRWNGEAWESMTSGDLEVNTETTALSIIASLNPQDISSDETINFIPSFCASVSGNVCNDLSNVNSLVNSVLSDYQDPVASIYFFEGEYGIKPYPGGQIVVP
jgi:hypothetical protein